MLRSATFVVLAFALGIPASAQRLSRQEIPFENSHVFGLVLVQGEVNGKPAVLIVDTGSNRTIISSGLAAARFPRLDSVVSTGKGSGWAGTGVSTRGTLKVGLVTWRDRRFIVMDMRELSKSLGGK